MSKIVSPPPRLYKYAAFTSQNLENLKNQSIYFSAPRNFNDPYDCSVVPKIKMLTDEEIEGLRNSYILDTHGLPVNAQFKKSSISTLREILMNSASKIIEEKVREFSEVRGVSCFSESCDDLLMWAHYGGNYRGFCLEFDTSHLQKLHKVRYSEMMPVFNPAPILSPDLDVTEFMSIFSTKSLSWAYEKEWRAMHETAGTLYGYPPEALTGVYFGPEISRAALEIICLILAGQNESVRFWKGVRDPNKYKVDFDNIVYFSHLQAKRGYGITRVPVSFKP